MTHAVLVVHAGRLVVERYGAGVGAGDTLRSWSVRLGRTPAALADRLTTFLAGVVGCFAPGGRAAG